MAASSAQGLCTSIHYMSVTTHSTHWAQFDYDSSIFALPVAVVGPWEMITNNQVEDDEDDSLILSAA
jgi:hypothetical protein